VPFEHGLTLARSIPNARFVVLESKNHLILSHEPAWGRFIDEICEFLKEEESALTPSAPRRAARGDISTAGSPATGMNTR
jgi:hypothetical protein